MAFGLTKKSASLEVDAAATKLVTADIRKGVGANVHAPGHRLERQAELDAALAQAGEDRGCAHFGLAQSSMLFHRAVRSIPLKSSGT